MPHSASLTLALGLALLLLPAATRAQAPAVPADGPVLTALRLPPDAAIVVDGLLEEPAWARAPVATGFLQRDPDNGAPATEATEVRIVYDADRLILGVMLHDGEPDRIVANQMQRDQAFDADDRFMWTLDTFLDGRSGYFFEINAAGGMGDGLIDPSSDGGFNRLGAGINRSWDGIWIARVRQIAAGWSAEIEIPFRTLNFDPEGATWGINFQRTVARKPEDSLWTGHTRNQGLARMANAGRLAGLTGLSQGVGLDLKPYVVGSVGAAPGFGRPSAITDGDAGIDLFYNLTPALRANLSLNTDFAQTEVDQRQVNLTRFPLFFEEKRDFFLEGSSYFDFSRDPDRTITPFFSRRIGLGADGLPQRIDFGGKLTGQVGAFDVGLLQVRTGGAAAQAGEDFSVLRVRRRAFTQSHVGGLYTRRATRGPGGVDRHTLGVDFLLGTSQFRGSQNLELSGFSIWTRDPLGEVGTTYGVYARYPNDPFRVNLLVREVSPHYDPAVGFRERVGFRLFRPDLGYFWRPPNPWIQEFDFHTSLSIFTDLDGRLLTRNLRLTPFDVNFNDGSRIRFDVFRHFERLEEDFEISDGVVLPAGREYTFGRYGFNGATAGHYVVSVNGNVQFGDFLSGSRRQYTAGVQVRPRRGVAIGVVAEHNVLSLAEGDFDTDVFRLNANTQFSPWLSLVNHVQYDTVTRLVGWQMRFRWIRRPGQDVYLVYVHNWHEILQTGDRRFETLENRLATKVVYTLRF